MYSFTLLFFCLIIALFVFSPFLYIYLGDCTACVYTLASDCYCASFNYALAGDCYCASINYALAGDCYCASTNYALAGECQVVVCIYDYVEYCFNYIQLVKILINFH